MPQMKHLLCTSKRRWGSNAGTDPNWWRFKIGTSLGGEEAVQAEDQRLNATVVAHHDPLATPDEGQEMQLST